MTETIVINVKELSFHPPHFLYKKTSLSNIEYTNILFK